MNAVPQSLKPVLKNEASEEFVANVQALENLSDKCFEHLRLIKRPWNLGVWLSLSHSIKTIYGAELRFPLSEVRRLFAVRNVGNLARRMMNWCVDYGSRPDLPLSGFRCTKDYWDDLQQAFEIAFNYEQFCRIFPRWHRYSETAELISENKIRFTHALSGLPRRVLAYNADMRPPGQRPDLTYEPNDPRLESLVSEIRDSVRRRQRHMRVDRRPELYAAAYRTYAENPAPIVKMFRRNSDVDVGGYTLGDFQSFFTALLAVMATHEELCKLWNNHPQKIPFISTVLIHSTNEWVRVIRSLNGQNKNIVEAIVSDLTYGAVRKRDPMLSPFVPVNTAKTQLAVAFPYVLASSAEDNVLRVCSHLRPNVFNLTTNTKEEEMRRTLRENASPEISVTGPVHLNSSLPDIDVILEHRNARVAIIAEAKWLATRQEKELLKGVSQCKSIKAFLNNNDDFLFVRKKLSRRLSDFRRVVFCVIARDYLIYNDPTDMPVIAFDAVLRALKMDKIDAGMDFLLAFDWLPQEGSDFSMNRYSANLPGVSISYEGYRRTYE